jgi:hypothetical protein
VLLSMEAVNNLMGVGKLLFSNIPDPRRTISEHHLTRRVAESRRTCPRTAISRASKSSSSTPWRPRRISISCTRSTANSSARVFFSLAHRFPSRFPHLGRADLLTDRDQLSHQVAEAAVLGNLRPGTFDGRTLRNDLGDRFFRRLDESTNMTGHVLENPPRRSGKSTYRICGIARSKNLDAGQTGGELFAFLPKSLQRCGHGRLLSDSYILSDKRRKPRPNLIKVPF